MLGHPAVAFCLVSLPAVTAYAAGPPVLMQRLRNATVAMRQRVSV